MNRAGTGRYVRELLSSLQHHPGVQVEPHAASSRRPVTPVSRLTQGIYREAVYYPLAIARHARRAGVDLVHCPAAFSPRVCDRPLVVTIHDVLPLRYPELFPRVVVAHSRMICGRAARRSARVIAVSEHAKGELVEFLGVPPERIAVTRHGVSTRFGPRAVDRGWLSERFGIDRRFVLCVGTLEPRKNLVGALRAFRLAAESVDDALLVVAGGKGWRHADFDRELGNTDRVRLTGRVSDEELAQLYAAAGCFLYPSLHEGFGLPVLEAMASGTPVVTSDRTSIPEVIGDAGISVGPRDIEALADAVARVLSDQKLAAELRARGLDRAAGYTWDACAEATVAIYREVLAEVG
jgi:glycosyltransferase involved in cell wall biosynthesis